MLREAEPELRSHQWYSCSARNKVFRSWAQGNRAFLKLLAGLQALHGDVAVRDALVETVARGKLVNEQGTLDTNGRYLLHLLRGGQATGAAVAKQIAIGELLLEGDPVAFHTAIDRINEGVLSPVFSPDRDLAAVQRALLAPASLLPGSDRVRLAGHLAAGRPPTEVLAEVQAIKAGEETDADE